MPTPSSTADRPAGITCEQYQRADDGKRCRHYRPKGGCALSSEPCIEWAKVNRAHSSSGPNQPTDLFGHPLSQHSGSRTTFAAPPVLASSAASAASPPPPPAITAEDIASFRELGVELCVCSDELGELWLVPSYTGQARKEITPEHVATVGRVLGAFPGARVVAFQPAPPAEGSPPCSRS